MRHGAGFRYASALLVLFCALAAAPALAEDRKPDSKTVTVKGKKRVNRIDRQTYDVAADPASKTDTAADTLSKVPGVTVDPSGEVKLRGNTVQILVNGKPSPLLAGDNRKAALRAMPSSTISSIEVMSTPGAQYGSEGAGGIINIVTKVRMAPGYFGSLGGQVDSRKGYSLNGFAQHYAGRFSTVTFGNLLQSSNQSGSRSSLSQRDAAGRTVRTTRSTAEFDSAARSVMINGNIDYDAGARDTVTGQFSLMRFDNDNDSTGRSDTYDATGAATDRYSSHGTGAGTMDSGMLAVTWTRTGKQLGDSLKVDARLSRNLMDNAMDNRLDYERSSVPGNTGEKIMRNRSLTRMTTAILSTDYNANWGDDQVTMGFQLTADDSHDLSEAFTPFSLGEAAVLNPALTSDFRYRQTLGAAYVTWQKAVGDRWVVLAGIRSETLDFESPDAAGNPVRVNYTRLNPSLFATYIVSDFAKIRLNYAHRLERPSPRDLNPSRLYIDTQTVTAGAPALKPQDIDSFEASYEYSKETTNVSLRAYHLRNDGMIHTTTRFVPDPQNSGHQVIEISRRNAGASDQTGLQFNYMAELSKRWNLNTTVNIYDTRLRLPDVAQRSLTTVTWQIGVNYNLRKGDVLSFSYAANGRQVSAEGVLPGFSSGAIRYYRNLTPSLSLNISADNLLSARKTVMVRDTPLLLSRDENRTLPVTFTIGLSKRFGSGTYAPPKEAT
ncbi:hypothetical protein ABAC460_00100 [Asticcacaulis sp. AC460]|uniref:TonB-dependent receptor n=1 Tax=Asticcacaulis sp. AC460 TaxID=1282360 RepID=UPI0003C3C052|nr:TonB-dependent receptor [Asticcacaulis sp. AC460]ESQ93502.1 hypothetical protein ABAC460_00100 [Asticcacaulis sp. AC460]